MQQVSDYEIELVQKLCENLEDLQLARQFQDPHYLLRFLRARDYCTEGAESMVRNWHNRRNACQIDHILTWSCPQKFKYFWPFYLTGYDFGGGPILAAPFGIWDPTKVGHGESYDAYIKYIYYVIENLWRLMTVRAGGKPSLKQITVIIDLEQFGLRSLTTINAFGGVLTAIKTFEYSYPEIVRSVLILNAPYLFGVAWKAIKPLISETTQEKVHLLGYDSSLWKEELVKYADQTQFPAKYGGTFPNDCGIQYENGIEMGRYYRSKLL